MANQFLALPAPAANGAGAAVDVSTFGGQKTVAVTGTGFPLQPTVVIEFSNEAAPTGWAQLCSFPIPGEKTVFVAARWMRARVTNYRGGGAPDVAVGGDDTEADFATVVAPAGSGAGAGVDISALEDFKTIHVASSFRGVLNVEISEDGGATFQQLCSFYGPGFKSFAFTAEFVRVTRVGVPNVNPGLPVINIGAVTAGGGAGGLLLEDNGAPVGAGVFTTLNFEGDVVVADAGGGVADIAIGGLTNLQIFSYTATGAEGDLFQINLPAARPDALYQVQVVMAGPAANTIRSVRPLASSRTVNDFDIELSGDAELGDVFWFIVADPT